MKQNFSETINSVRRDFLIRVVGVSTVIGLGVFGVTGVSASLQPKKPTAGVGTDAAVQLCVLYPRPQDTERFDAEYRRHLALVTEQTGRSFTVSKFVDGDGDAPYYQMFTMEFDSMTDFESVMTATVTDVLNADAIRISTGGQPIILVGTIAP